MQEGKTGTAPDGTRVIYRNGKVTPLHGPKTPMYDTKTDQEALEKLREEARRAQWVHKQAQEFGRLNEQTGTGPGNGFGIPFVAPTLGADIAKVFSPNTAAMESITSRVAPGMRPTGSGSSSDRDMAMFVQAFPNIKNYGETNGKIEEQLAADAAEKAALGRFADEWYTRNGTLLGMQAAWEARRGQQRAAPTTPKNAPPSKAAPQSGYRILSVE